MGIGLGVFGAVIGGIFGGPLGALIGGGIGAMINGGASAEKRNVRASVNGVDTDVSEEDIHIAVLKCLGKLAKSDGRVSEEEAEYISEFIHRLTSDRLQRKKFIAAFNEGRDSNEDFYALLKELNVLLRVFELDDSDVRALKIRIVLCFCSLVLVDRHVDRQEFKLLKAAAEILDVPEVVEQFFAGYNHDSNRSNAADVRRDSLDDAYALLGITAAATDDEVKKAFRKKAKEHHPDLAQGAGLSAVKIEEAKKKFQAVALAYEAIRDARGMK